MSKFLKNEICKFFVILFLLMIIVYMCFVCNSVRVDNDQFVYEFWENKGIEKAILKYIAAEVKSENVNIQNNIIVTHHCSTDNTSDTITISYMDDDDIYWLWKNNNQYIAFCKEIENRKIIYVPKVGNNYVKMISSSPKKRSAFLKKIVTKEQYKFMVSRIDKVNDIFQRDCKEKVTMVFNRTK